MELLQEQKKLMSTKCDSDEQILGDGVQTNEHLQDGQQILPSEETHSDNCEIDSENLGEDEKADELVQDGQEILPSEDNNQTDPDKL